MSFSRRKLEAVIAEAGFARNAAGGAECTIDGTRVVCAFGDTTNDGRTERVTFWVALEQARPEASGYRASGQDVAPEPVPFVARRQSGLDEIGKRVGLNRELELGDAEFDHRVYLESDAPDAALRDLLREPVRRAILSLLDAGADEVAIRPSLGRLSAVRETSLAELGPKDVGRIAQSLALARVSLPRFRQVAVLRRARSSVQLALALALWVLALGGAVACASLWQSRDLLAILGRPSTLSTGVIGLLLVFGAAWAASRNSSTGLRRFALIAVPGAIVWSSSLLLFFALV